MLIKHIFGTADDIKAVLGHLLPPLYKADVVAIVIQMWTYLLIGYYANNCQGTVYWSMAVKINKIFNRDIIRLKPQ